MQLPPFQPVVTGGAVRLSDWIEGLSEQSLFTVVEDLLAAMHFKRIECVHGPGEVGKDIVFMQEDPLRRQVWRAAQVKTKITGNSSAPNNALTAILQCEAALRNPYMTSAGPVSIDEVWLIIASPLGAGAKQYIEATLSSPGCRIVVVDGPRFCDLVAEHLPKLVTSGRSPSEQYMSNLMQVCDTPDEFLRTVFKAKFGLTTVFVQPDCVLEFLAPSAFTGFSGFATTIDWQLLKSMNASLTMLRRRTLPLFQLVSLRSTLKQLQQVADTIARSSWDHARGREFSHAVSEIAATVEAEARDPLFSRTDLNFIEDQIRLLPNAEVAPLRLLHKLRSDERTDRRSYWDRRIEADRNSRVKEIADAEIAAQVFLNRVYDCYTKCSDDKDPLAAVTVAISLLLDDFLAANERRRQRSPILENAPSFEDHVALLSNYVRAFDRYVDQLKTQYVGTYNRIQRVLTRAGSSLDAVDPTDSEAITLCNQLTFLFKAILGPKCTVLTVPVDSASAVTMFPRTLFYADLGMGKSTFLNHLCFRLAEAYIKGSRDALPLHVLLGSVRLKEAEDRETQVALLTHATEAFAGLPEYVSQHNVWLLDGLDEMESADARDRVLRWCESGAKQSDSVVVTSRPYDLPHYAPCILRVRLLPFSPTQRRTFLNALPWANPNEPRQLISIIENEPDLAEISKTPLLLTLIVVLANHDGIDHIPKRRDKIYRRIVSLMLYEWDRKKGIDREYAIRDEDLRLGLLRKLAYYCHSRNERTFRRTDVITALLNSVSGISSDIASGFHDDLLRDCLLVPVGSGRYAFFHLSVQEYLTGLELAQDLTLGRVGSALENYFRLGTWWEEPLVFLAAIRRDVTILINELDKRLVRPRAEETRARTKNLVERWLGVADMTNLAGLNPRGVVAEVLGELDVGGFKARWQKMAEIQ
jgi:hypothetical protein